MSFLQPAMLFALPAIALPIIIHLINQRRLLCHIRIHRG